jgi:hypothetical protein
LQKSFEKAEETIKSDISGKISGSSWNWMRTFSKKSGGNDILRFQEMDFTDIFLTVVGANPVSPRETEADKIPVCWICWRKIHRYSYSVI